MSKCFDFVEALGEGFHSGELEVHLRKVDPNERVSLDHFAFVRWYMDEEVSLDYSEEAERLVGWSCKVILMDLQREIFLKINALKRGRDQERLSFKEGSNFQPLRQGRSFTAQIQYSRDRKTIMHLHPLNRIKNWGVN